MSWKPATVNIPVDATITSVDVEYEMTALGGAAEYLDVEQRSELRCNSTGGINEGTLYNGSGNVAGTYTYSRTGLTIANGVTGGGNIDFELHAGRTYGGSGCNTTYNKVDNNSWTVTVYYTPGTPTPPSCTTPTNPTDGETDVAVTTTLDMESVSRRNRILPIFWDR